MPLHQTEKKRVRHKNNLKLGQLTKGEGDIFRGAEGEVCFEVVTEDTRMSCFFSFLPYNNNTISQLQTGEIFEKFYITKHSWALDCTIGFNLPNTACKQETEPISRVRPGK